MRLLPLRLALRWVVLLLEKEKLQARERFEQLRVQARIWGVDLPSLPEEPTTAEGPEDDRTVIQKIKEVDLGPFSTKFTIRRKAYAKR